MKVNPEIGGKEDDDAVAAHIRELLLDAARIHLRSDVAVGTCLSGGIDSSTLTVLINTLIRSEAPESVGARQKTFSVVFSDKKFDESRYIDEVVAVTGVDADRTEPAPDQLWEDIDRLVYLQDEPFGSLSIYAQYCVMRLAAKKVKVVLDGQGADELLAGYLGYQGSYIKGLIRSFHWWTALCEIIGSLRKHRDFFHAARQQLRIRKARRGLLKCIPETIDRYQVRSMKSCTTSWSPPTSRRSSTMRTGTRWRFPWNPGSRTLMYGWWSTLHRSLSRRRSGAA